MEPTLWGWPCGGSGNTVVNEKDKRLLTDRLVGGGGQLGTHSAAHEGRQCARRPGRGRQVVGWKYLAWEMALQPAAEAGEGGRCEHVLEEALSRGHVCLGHSRVCATRSPSPGRILGPPSSFVLGSIGKEAKASCGPGPGK